MMFIAALAGLAAFGFAASAVAEPDAGAAAANQAAPAKTAAEDSDTREPSGSKADEQTALDASLEQSFEAPEQTRVGQRLELRLEVTHPVGASVHLPESFGNPRWELVDTRRETLAADETTERTKLALVFQIFRPGSTTLPAFDVTVMQSDGATVQLETEPVEAKVVSVLPPDKTPDPQPHQSPVSVWTDDYTPAWAGGILLTALLAGGLAFLIGRRRDEDDAGPPLRPAHVVALEKLSALTTDDLLDRGEYMLYYVRMSGAVREYLGRRYGFRGTELTTTEILDHLERVDWPVGLSLEDVRDWLLHCDLIKFSGVIPARERAEQTLRRGFSIVELTRERPEAESETQTEPDTETQADSKTEPEPDSQTETAPESESAPESEPETQPEPEAETEPEATPDSDTDAETKPEGGE